MSRAADRLARVVDALLHERKPPRFPAEPEEAAALYAAAALKASRPGADLPSRDFIANLERQLGAEVARAEAAPGRGRRFTRRTLLQVCGASAAAAVAGVLVDRAVTRPEARPAPTTMVPTSGRWIPVVSLAALAPGQGMRFSSSGVEGFVVNHAGNVQAMSAVCTHMGCILRFNQRQARLDCPCHGASFDLDGSPLARGYLDSLPRLASRVRADHVEVQVPA
ncbi:MAG TPA: Rieske (2Fe-2S) protein [Candidatus Dormibacteraeota bacterium]